MNSHQLLRPRQLIFLLLLISHRNILARGGGGDGGKWNLLLSNIGISAMHMQLLHTDRVVIFDRSDFGHSNISLPAGKCRGQTSDKPLPEDCTAHSVEYDVASNSVRPLTVLTDTWCSSGAVMTDGTLIQTGGYNSGDHAVRIYDPCEDNSCDWREINSGLAQRRWYATNHILPDGRQIIIGGRRQFNYEFYPKTSAAEKSYNLQFLVQTNDPQIENNLYPFVFLNSDGNLFILANNRAILFNYQNGVVVKTYPNIPGGDPRNYPSTGSAVLLPLTNDANGAEVLVCGGAPKESYPSANKGNFVTALDTCGRIRINDPNPQWVMETMPVPRVMGDMLLLPNGDVLIINGGGSGTAGWELGRDPVFTPVLYNPDGEIGSRFEIQNPTSTPRMYHSSAVLLRDGRVLVGGNNPHTYYNFTGVLFPTDLSLEAFSPPYIASSNPRLTIVDPVSHFITGYNRQMVVRFAVDTDGVDQGSVMVTMVRPSFTTHSFAMNQRLLVLSIVGKLTRIESSVYEVPVMTPVSGKFAPSGYYLMFVVHRRVPSEGIWVKIGQ